MARKNSEGEPDTVGESTRAFKREKPQSGPSKQTVAEVRKDLPKVPTRAKAER